MKKKGQGGTGHNLVRQDAVPERANLTVPLRSLNIFKNPLSKTKHQKKRIRAAPAIRGAKMRPSRDGAKSTVPLRFLKIYKNAFSKKKHQKMRITTTRRIRAAKKRVPKMTNTARLKDFTATKFRRSRGRLRRLRTPQPSPEGLYGVRRP